MDSSKLKKLQEPMSLKWRVKALLPDNKNPTQMTIVGYVDSRQVQERFDDVLGPENWQDDYYESKNKQFCKIGVKIGGEWIWKGDSGSESILDKTKGETSDAFKRAAVHWGVNRDAYELGEIIISCKMIGESPVPVDKSGNQLSGNKLLEDCKRISALKDSELKFDRNVLPSKNIASTPESITPKRKTAKSKVILP